nr:MAG TPA: hypothetical protein [Caudoviricetes sp.]
MVYPYNTKQNVGIETINLFHCRRILLKTAKVTAPEAVLYRGLRKPSKNRESTIHHKMVLLLRLMFRVRNGR